MNGRHLIKLLELAPESVRNEIGLTANNRDECAACFGNDPGAMAMALFYACRTITSAKRAAPIIASMKIDAQTIHRLIQFASAEEFAKTQAILGEIKKAEASKRATAAVNARHKKADSRHNQVKDGQKKVLNAWKSGKYTTKTICVDEEYQAAGISRKKAEEALRNK